MEIRLQFNAEDDNFYIFRYTEQNCSAAYGGLLYRYLANRGQNLNYYQGTLSNGQCAFKVLNCLFIFVRLNTANI